MAGAGSGHVLVLGWKPGLLNAVRRARVPVLVAVDTSTLTEGERVQAEHVRLLHVAEPGDVTAVLAALLRSGEPRLRGVAALSERAVGPAAFLRAALGLVGPGPTTAVAFRDKSIQKELVRRAGVSVARAARIEVGEAGSADDAVRACGGLPIVVKPVDGVGASCTTIARTVREVLAAADEIRLRTRGPALAEEFVGGAEHHVDGWVRNGAVEFSSVARYRENVLSVTDGALLRSSLLAVDHPLQARARVLAQRAVAALGLADGTFHLEFFATADGDLVFSECGARPGGGFITQTIAARYGVDLRAVAVESAGGLQANLPDRIVGGAFGFTFLTAPPGRVVRQPSRASIRELPGVLEARLTVAPGSLVPDNRASSGRRYGLALVTGVTSSELERRMDAVVAYVHDHTEVSQ